MSISLTEDVGYNDRLLRVSAPSAYAVPFLATIDDETVVVVSGAATLIWETLRGADVSGRSAHLAGAVVSPVAVAGGSSLPLASQDEMEAGTEAGERSMSPLRVAQGIAALGGGGIVPVFAQLYGGAPDSSDTEVWTDMVDRDSVDLDLVWPTGMGMAWNAHGSGFEWIDITEAGTWLLSAYASPIKDDTALVDMYLQEPNSPSGGPRMQLPNISSALWGTVGIEMCLADVLSTSGPTAHALTLLLSAFSATGTPWHDAGLTIVRIA